MINEWLGISTNASHHGLMLDHMLGVVHAFMAFLFIGWSAFFFYVVWRFSKRRNPKANYHGTHSKFSTHAEIGVVIVEVILLLGLAFPLWGKQVNEFPKPEDNPLVVHAVGEQFMWSIHYPGPDGIFGSQEVELISNNNKLGIDWTDPNAQDDLVRTNELVVPVGRPVVVYVSSKDVIHNFAIYTMRVAQDAIPGSRIPMWFAPIKAGEWEIICGQLCGTNHYAMKAIITAVPATEFEEWLKQADQNQSRNP
jgi:cytochrome c oxidase subunit 2